MESKNKNSKKFRNEYVKESQTREPSGTKRDFLKLKVCFFISYNGGGFFGLQK